MLMRVAARLFEGAAAPWIKTLAIPALLLGTVTMAHQTVKAVQQAREAREQRDLLRGRSQCFAEVQLAQARAAEQQAIEEAARARAEAKSAQDITEKVEADARDLQVQMAALRARVIPDHDLVGRCCISRGVCSTLRDQRAQSPAGPGDSAGGTGGAGGSARPEPGRAP